MSPGFFVSVQNNPSFDTGIKDCVESCVKDKFFVSIKKDYVFLTEDIVFLRV